MSLDGKLFNLYLDGGRYIFEKTPLKYIGSGYWSEKYAKDSLKIIHEYEKVSIKSNISEEKRTELFKKTERKLAINDLKLYGNWMVCFSPLLIGWFSIEMNLITSLSYFLLIHEFACPSSIRKYYELKKRNENKLAGIVGNRASPSAARYFRKTHKDLYGKLAKKELTCLMEQGISSKKPYTNRLYNIFLKRYNKNIERFVSDTKS